MGKQDLTDRTKEWLKQAHYDLETAEAMQASGHYVYVVFMCHLAVEKALKGLFTSRRQEVPPKSHSLSVLLTRLGSDRPPESVGRFIFRLSEASIPARYPDDLAKAQIEYSQVATAEIIEKAREAVSWIEKQLSK
jgi:HEPN domain-containing protein